MARQRRCGWPAGLALCWLAENVRPRLCYPRPFAPPLSVIVGALPHFCPCAADDACAPTQPPGLLFAKKANLARARSELLFR